VLDIESTRAFYAGLLGCPVGREASDWIDFDLHGHQISAHVMPGACREREAHDVDGDNVPVRHFGLVLPWEEWHRWRDQLQARGVRFLIEPHLRFVGQVGEQATMFIVDPSGNAIEFKSFRDPTRVFARPSAP